MCNYDTLQASGSRISSISQNTLITTNNQVLQLDFFQYAKGKRFVRALNTNALIIILTPDSVSVVALLKNGSQVWAGSQPGINFALSDALAVTNAASITSQSFASGASGLLCYSTNVSLFFDLSLKFKTTDNNNDIARFKRSASNGLRAIPLLTEIRSISLFQPDLLLWLCFSAMLTAPYSLAPMAQHYLQSSFITIRLNRRTRFLKLVAQCPSLPQMQIRTTEYRCWSDITLAR